MIKNILVETAEDCCEIDVDMLHKTLLELPAEKYLDLFKKIHEKIYGYSPFVNWGIGGCCGAIEDDPLGVAYYGKESSENRLKHIGNTEFAKRD